MPPKKRLKNQRAIDSSFKRVNSDSESMSTVTCGQLTEETRPRFNNESGQEKLRGRVVRKVSIVIFLAKEKRKHVLYYHLLTFQA